MGTEIESLQVGDPVVILGFTYPIAATVERVTKTTVIVNGEKYSKAREGRQIGSSGFRKWWIELPNERNAELIKDGETENRVMAARYRLRDVKVTAENVEKVEVFIKCLEA